MKIKLVLEKLGAGEITLSKGAEMLNISILDFLDLVKQQNIEWITDGKFIKEDITKEI